MPVGILIGPYARQSTGWKLKFWFAFVTDDHTILRYEVTGDRHSRKVVARHRPVYDGRVPKQAGNFSDYLVPEDLSDLPHTHYPRFPRDRLADAALTLLPPEYVADLTRLHLTGELPLVTGPAPAAAPLLDVVTTS